MPEASQVACCSAHAEPLSRDSHAAEEPVDAAEGVKQLKCWVARVRARVPEQQSSSHAFASAYGQSAHEHSPSHVVQEYSVRAVGREERGRWVALSKC